MSRTVTALYDSRAEAEIARGRLIAGIRTEATRIIAKDTVAAVDTLQLAPDQAKMYRDAISGGGHLLVAEIQAGQDPKQVVRLLEQSAGGAHAVAEPKPEAPTYGFMGVTDERPAESELAAPVAAEPVAPPVVAPPMRPMPVKEPEVSAPKVATPAPVAAARQPVQESPNSRIDDELRIGMPNRARGGARVRSVIRETPAEEQVALSEEHVDVEHRPSERRVSFEDVKAGGLLRERVFEIREMREEPVVT